MTAYSGGTRYPAETAAEQTHKTTTAATLPEELFSIEKDDEPNIADPQQQQGSVPVSTEPGMSFLT